MPPAARARRKLEKRQELAGTATSTSGVCPSCSFLTPPVSSEPLLESRNPGTFLRLTPDQRCLGCSTCPIRQGVRRKTYGTGGTKSAINDFPSTSKDSQNLAYMH